ncbi:hypothetical protein Gotri_026337 [Gossypium trilobum]|uniref:Uncharacterized protein n=1 Tax=Gossypium trilobum TaxID=34281 RepID=A0A7J9FIV2_9ROSI|nr:hypothetical protein [Gossypium trilobum]
MSNAWKQVHQMKRFTVRAMKTLEYYEWWSKRVNDNILGLEAEKLKKGKNKAEEDLDSLKMDYKKLRLSIRTAGLGKTSEQWRQEIKEEKTKADQWGKKFQDARARKSALEKNLLECRSRVRKFTSPVP